MNRLDMVLHRAAVMEGEPPTISAMRDDQMIAGEPGIRSSSARIHAVYVMDARGCARSSRLPETARAPVPESTLGRSVELEHRLDGDCVNDCV